MSKRLYGSMFCGFLYAVAAAAPAAADSVVQTNVGADTPTTSTTTTNTPQPASGSVQAAPSTTVVQPGSTSTVTQPASSTTVVQPPATTQTPVVVERAEPEPRQPVVQQTQVDTAESEPPSVFSRAAQGLLVGGLMGAAGGYLVGRQDDWQRSDWRAVGLGVGIGSLAGTGFGLMLGLLDHGGVRAGRYIPRDMMAGAGLGAAVGAISGGIAAAAANDAERVVFGASVGVLAGAGLGLLTGVITGQLRENRDETQTTTTVTSRLKLAPSIAWARPSQQGSGVLMPSLAGRF